jgi:3-hydroxyacyl-CoA dehydrogenase
MLRDAAANRKSATEPVRAITPLQGADIVATESSWHAITVLRNGLGSQPRAHLRHFLDNMFAQGFIVGRDNIADMLVRNFDADGRRLEHS